jgi:hypothetical protein
MRSRHVKSLSTNYTYWLTSNHLGNFSDVPLTEVSVEGRFLTELLLTKHCRKNRRRKEEPWSKYIHSTNPNPRVNLLESQEHVQVTLRHPQNIRIDLMACMLVTRIRQLPQKSSCLPTHSHLHLTATTQRTSHDGKKAWNLIKKSRKKIMQQKAYKFHKEIWDENKEANAKNRNRIDYYQPLLFPSVSFPWPSSSVLHPKACRLIKKSHNGQTSMKSHQKIS